MNARKSSSLAILGVLALLLFIACFMPLWRPADAVSSQFSEVMGRGRLSAKRGDYDSAISTFSGAIRLRPSAPDAYFERALAYRQSGRPGMAIADCDQAIRLDPQYGDAYEARAWAYEDKGNLDKALEDLTSAIR